MTDKKPPLCLRCNKPYNKLHKFNRICPSCAKLNEREKPIHRITGTRL